MGRGRRVYPKGKLRLMVKGKAAADKTYPIYYEYSWYSIPIRKATTFSAKECDWNSDGDNGRGELRASFGSDYKRINNQLHSQIDSYDRAIADYHAKHPGEISPDLVKSILEGKPINRQDEGRDAVEFIKQHLRSEYDRNIIGKSRYENGLSGLKIFVEFLKVKELGTYKPDSLLLGDLTPEILDKYITYRREIKGNVDETINHALTPILKAYNEACSIGYIDGKKNAEIQKRRIVIKGESLNEDKSTFDGEYLSKAKIRQLVTYCNACQEPRRKEYLEMFLFAFHAAGLRIVDIMTLQWDSINLDSKLLTKTQVKTRRRAVIPLTDSAIAILKKWQSKSNGRFVFGLLPDDFDCNDQEALYKIRNNVTKNIDQSIKVVGEELGFKLTFHRARHSFAMNALNDKMPMAQVSQLIGHSSIATTERIYARYLPKTLAEEMQKLNYDFLPELD